MIELVALTLATLVWTIWQNGRQLRACQERAATERAQLLQSQVSPDLEALIALVDRLCQRVQAPEVAVAQHVDQTTPVFAPQPLSPDDDEAWLMDKEELAERMMEQELGAA